MAQRTLVWRGTRLIVEQPGSPEQVDRTDDSSIVRTFRGPYGTLYNTRPSVGNQMAGYADYYVTEVKITPDGAGKSGPGTLTVTLSKEGIKMNNVGAAITHEIDFVEVSKSIEQHPRYNGAAFNGAKLTDEGKIGSEATLSVAQVWDEIKTAGTLKERKDWLAKITSADHRSLVADLWRKHARGQENYTIYAPVARRTSQTFLTPNTQKCGIRQTPATFPSLPNGYEWLKTADRAVRQGKRGKWERVEEWTGADAVDHDFYPEG